MTSCPARRELARLLSDNLTEVDNDALVDHVGECARCQKVLEDLTAEAEVWPDLNDRLNAQDLSWPESSNPMDMYINPSEWPDLPNYQILSVLGIGGMGVVYKARHKTLGRLVALKMMRADWQDDAGFRQRFLREAETVARLKHPNLVQIYDIIDHEGQPMLALEFVNGISLAERLRKSWLSPKEAAELVETMARAMQSAHDIRTIHRDLKPANVLLATGSDPVFEEPTVRQEPEQILSSQSPTLMSPDALLPTPPPEPVPTKARTTGRSDQVRITSDMVKITDFGLARRLESSTHTNPGVLMGTPSYMAPEQAQGLPNWNQPAVDIYALGAILYEALTGRPPFLGETSFDTMQRVVKEDPISPSQYRPKLPRDLITICLTCLHKSPSARYKSCTELAEDLHRFRKGQPIRAQRVPFWVRAWKWIRRHPVSTGLLALTIVTLFALIGVWIKFTRDLQQVNTELQASNQSLHQQSEIARAKQQEAEIARNNADLQKRQLMISLVGTLNILKSYHERIRKEPALQRPELKSVRNKLLTESARSLESALGQMGNAENVREVRSQGYFWLGKTALHLGNLEKGQYLLRRAIVIREAMPKDNNRKGRWAAELGEMRMHLAIYYMENGFTDMGPQLLKNAINIFEEEAPYTEPTDGYVYFLLAQARSRLANHTRSLKMLKSAQEAVTEALRREPNNAIYKRLEEMISGALAKS